MNLLLKDLLKKFNGAFLDVGVNVGQTLCKVKTLEPERAYVGFEPNPLCVHYVQELVGLHYFRNVRLLPIGLSDQDGVLELELHTEDLADSSATIVRNFRPRHKVFRSMAIQVRRFGSVDRELGIGKLGIIKIDVEGAEKEVLLGLEETLIRDRPAVIVEILPVGNIPERAQRQADVEALFKRCRYALQRIGMRGDKLTLEPVNGAIGVLHDQKLSNYVALPD